MTGDTRREWPELECISDGDEPDGWDIERAVDVSLGEMNATARVTMPIEAYCEARRLVNAQGEVERLVVAAENLLSEFIPGERKNEATVAKRDLTCLLICLSALKAMLEEKG